MTPISTSFCKNDSFSTHLNASRKHKHVLSQAPACDYVAHAGRFGRPVARETGGRVYQPAPPLAGRVSRVRENACLRGRARVCKAYKGLCFESLTGDQNKSICS